MFHILWTFFTFPNVEKKCSHLMNQVADRTYVLVFNMPGNRCRDTDLRLWQIWDCSMGESVMFNWILDMFHLSSSLKIIRGSTELLLGCNRDVKQLKNDLPKHHDGWQWYTKTILPRETVGQARVWTIAIATALWLLIVCSCTPDVLSTCRF